MTTPLTLQAPEPPLTDPFFDLPKSAPDQLKSPPGWTWAQFFLSLVGFSARSPQRIATISETGKTASIGTTNIPLPALPSGLYRLSIYVRVTVADGVGSSILTTIGSTDGGVPCTQATAAYVGNNVGQPQSATILVQADAATPISYATTYVSGGGGPAMAYDLSVVIESIGG